MPNHSQKHLLFEALHDLYEEEFKTFKWFLQDEDRRGFRLISRSRLCDANRRETVDMVVQVYDLRAVEVSAEVLRKMKHFALVMRLTEVNSKDEVKSTVCHFQMNNTATHGSTVFNPIMNNCHVKELTFNFTSPGAAGRHMAEQLYRQTLVLSPERPLGVFPSQVCSVLNVLSGQVDADDLFLLSLKEQLKNLEPEKKSLMKLKIQETVHKVLHPETRMALEQ